MVLILYYISYIDLPRKRLGSLKVSTLKNVHKKDIQNVIWYDFYSSDCDDIWKLP